MSIIDRYVARSFVSGYLLLLVVAISLVILLHLLVNMDELTKDRSRSLGEVLSILGDYYLYNLPLYYAQLGGPLLGIAAAFTLAFMLRNNEMTALVASGMPLQRLLAPLLVCSIGFLGLWIMNRELLIPGWAEPIARTQGVILDTRMDGVYCARDQRNAVLTALRIIPRANRLENVFIVEPTETQPGQPALPTNLIEADSATYDAQRGLWRLERGRRLVMARPDLLAPGELGESLRYEPVEECLFGLTPGELALRQTAEWAELLSLRQMNDLLSSGLLPNRAAVEMSRHARLTYPINQLTLMLLAVGFFLSREPRSVLGAGGLALLVGGIFFLLTFFVAGMVSDDGSAALVVWSPLLVFGPVAVLKLANIRT